MIKEQHGVTLIELMISMVLGLGLVAGIGQLFVQSQKSFTLQRNLSDMTDDATFILESLAKGVFLAGFSDDGYDFKCSKTFNAATGNTTNTTCGHIKNTQTNALSSGLSLDCTTETTTNMEKTSCETTKGDDNALIYRYVIGNPGIYAPAGELKNFFCTSSLTGNNGDVVSVYIYTKNDSDNIPVLYCRAATYTPPANAPASTPSGQPLISEVEKLEFRYGIKEESSGLFYYTTSADITDWTKVFAIKVFLVMRSIDKNLTKNKTGWSIDGGATEYPTTDEKRLYRVFSKTIFLRANDH